jgi:hypothetical protein
MILLLIMTTLREGMKGFMNKLHEGKKKSWGNKKFSRPSIGRPIEETSSFLVFSSRIQFIPEKETGRVKDSKDDDRDSSACVIQNF